MAASKPGHAIVGARWNGNPWRPTRATVLAGAVTLVVWAWVVLILAIPDLHFVVISTRAKTGIEVIAALLQLFVALVLALFPDEETRRRLGWVALGFLFLGLGGLGFGYVLPLTGEGHPFASAMYGSLLARTAGMAAMAIGLALRQPPVVSRRVAVSSIAAFAFGGILIGAVADRLPPLTRVTDLHAVADAAVATMPGLTGWHWLLAPIPLVLAFAAVIGAIRHLPGRVAEGWLALALAVMAGAQLHTVFWPSAYSPIVTTASLLRLAFVALFACGAVLELRHVAAARAALLATQQEVSSRLADLHELRADITKMIAHELTSPVAAIRAYAAMLTTGALDTRMQFEAGETIRAEAALLDALIADVRAVASIENDEFELRPVAAPLARLLADAAAFAGTLPGEHPVDIDEEPGVSVRADPARIGQVLRNLLVNAAKYSPPGSPISIRAVREGDHVRIGIVDRGPGIHPDDRERIFEKFGRGRESRGNRIPGLGVGLYLARRIVRAHGGDLHVESVPGEGSTFWFDLEICH